MKKILFLLVITVACSSFQQQQTKPAAKHPVQKKTKAKKTVPPATVKQTLPAAIQKRIEAYKKMDKSEQPRSVVEYEYKGQKVYYVNMPCCDFFNELYDSTGTLMGHPDGGITGRGDGKLPDFNKEKTKEKIVWKAAN